MWGGDNQLHLIWHVQCSIKNYNTPFGRHVFTYTYLHPADLIPALIYKLQYHTTHEIIHSTKYRRLASDINLSFRPLTHSHTHDSSHTHPPNLAKRRLLISSMLSCSTTGDDSAVIYESLSDCSSSMSSGGGGITGAARGGLVCIRANGAGTEGGAAAGTGGGGYSLLGSRTGGGLGIRNPSGMLSKDALSAAWSSASSSSYTRSMAEDAKAGMDVCWCVRAGGDGRT